MDTLLERIGTLEREMLDIKASYVLTKLPEEAEETNVSHEK